MELLNLPQLRLVDRAVDVLAQKEKFLQRLQEGISLKVEKEQEGNFLKESFLCCGCLPSESTRLKQMREYNLKHAFEAILCSRPQNETLFQIRTTENTTHIGSWYEIFVFEEWQDSFSSTQSPQQFEPSSSLFNQHQWYSKISLWFSNKQLKFILTKQSQHRQLFRLFITMKTYYTKLHPESHYNSLALRQFVHYNVDKDTHLSQEEIDKLRDDLNLDHSELERNLGQLAEFSKSGKLSQEEFMKLIEVMQCPEDLYQVYKRYAKSAEGSDNIYERHYAKEMSQGEFNLFLKQVQCQGPQAQGQTISFLSSSVCSSKNYIQPITARKQSRSQPQQKMISYIQFCQYLLSNSKNPSIQPQQLPGSKPLTHYFVNSSHNTYLVGNQLTSMSSANVYYLNLIEGMRCVELDIHDSPQGPMIKHGFTFTAKILFQQAMNAIMKFCIQNPNHTPLILSFQNHCSEPNRIKMVQTLAKIPFSKFYAIPAKSTNEQEYPTLEQLRGKIIIQGTGNFDQMFPGITKVQKKVSQKNKLKSTNIVAPESSSPFDPIKKREFMDKVKQLEVQKALAEKVLLKVQKQFEQQREPSSLQLNKYYGLVAAPFSMNNSCWQMANIAENNLLKMVKGQMQPTAEQIYQYSWNSMIRIYPYGLRFGSSNFNPIPMLQCGCQLVSLNTQNVDVYYVCVQGMFERNRHCGYMLKPDIKQQNGQRFLYRIAFMDGMDLRPRLPVNSDTPTTLQVSFIGSQQDMKTNFKYVNNSNSPNSINSNEPVTISKPFRSQNIQVQLVAEDKFRHDDSKTVLRDIFTTPYPSVELTVSNVEFANLYVNVPHCGSMSLPLIHLRSGMRVVPIYRFDIGRKKTKGYFLMHVDIQKAN